MPMQLTGELLPAESKAIGNSIVQLVQVNENIALCFADIVRYCASSLQYIGMLSMNTSLPYLLDALELHGIFWLFSCVVTANAINGYICMPETKDLSLEQIQDKYYKKKSGNVDEVKKISV